MLPFMYVFLYVLTIKIELECKRRAKCEAKLKKTDDTENANVINGLEAVPIDSSFIHLLTRIERMFWWNHF